MRHLTIFATAIAVAVASPCAAAELAPDESGSAILAASAAVVDAREEAASVLASRTLEPGGYWWDTKAMASVGGETEVVISLEDQLAFVYRGGQMIGVSTISSGKLGKDTPVGIFPILEKKRTHFSRKYDNAPMPFMQRLDQWGIALHAGVIPGRPASRGCVRLPAAFAAKLFGMTDVGDRVVIG